MFVNPLSDHKRYVYHYTKLDTALNYILPHRTLMMNSFRNLNDPRESKDWEISVQVRSSSKFEYEDYDKVSKNASDLLKSRAKILCLSHDKPEAQGAWQPEALPMRGFSISSMWQHYADAYGGVCLAFDRNKLNAALARQLKPQRLASDDVSYSDEGISLILGHDPFFLDITRVFSNEGYIAAVQDHLVKWMPRLFFRKMKAWEYEQEYRWVYFDEDDEPLLVEFDDALAGIVACSGTPADGDELLRQGALYKAEYTGLGWHNGYPKIMGPTEPWITHRHLLETETP